MRVVFIVRYLGGGEQSSGTKLAAWSSLPLQKFSHGLSPHEYLMSNFTVRAEGHPELSLKHVSSW